MKIADQEVRRCYPAENSVNISFAVLHKLHRTSTLVGALKRLYSYISVLDAITI